MRVRIVKSSSFTRQHNNDIIIFNRQPWLLLCVVIWQIIGFFVFFSPMTMFEYIVNVEDATSTGSIVRYRTNTTDKNFGPEVSSQSSAAVKIDQSFIGEEKRLLTKNSDHQESVSTGSHTNEHNNATLIRTDRNESINEFSFLDDHHYVRAKSIPRIRRTIQNNIHTLPTKHYTNTTTSGQNRTNVFSPSSSCPSHLVYSNISISLLTQSSISRLHTLDMTCQRWKSPIIVVIAWRDPLDASDRNELQEYIEKWKITCKQMQVIVYHLDQETEGTPEAYPINSLRNIALEAVSTSHILMIDVDFIPSNRLDIMIKLSIMKQQKQRVSNDNTYSKKMKYDEYDGDMNKDAIVIPAFDRRANPPCTTSTGCAQLLQNKSRYIPSNFDELQHCYYKTKNCIVFDRNINKMGHSSTRTNLWLQRKWYLQNENDTDANSGVMNATSRGENKVFRTIPCFDSIAYEPYVVLRWCPITSSSSRKKMTASLGDTAKTMPIISPVAPYYDERFLGYGHNKIQYVAHIRWMGYRFAVLPKGGFLVHSPHVMSSQKSIWLNGDNELRRNNTNLFDNFINELDSIYGTTVRTMTKNSRDRAYPRECVTLNVTNARTASTKADHKQANLQFAKQLRVRTTSSTRIRRTIHNNAHIIRNVQSNSENIDIGNQTTTQMSSSCPRILLQNNITVSLLTQSSISRLRTLDVTCQRWKSPIIVVIVVSDEFDASNNTLLQDHLRKWKNTCQHIQVIFYLLDSEMEESPENYPINSLRNIALEAVSTSHILMIDVDFIPSEGLDRMIKSAILEQQQESTETNASNTQKYGNVENEITHDAIVIPAFDRRVKPLCETTELCAQLLQNNSNFIPSDFDELRHCYKTKECIVFDRDINVNGHSSTNTHLWIQKKWYVPNQLNSGNYTTSIQLNTTTSKTEAPKEVIRTLPCFGSLAYEPYVVLRWCPISSTPAKIPVVAPVAPYYDERFLGYGHNKIQFIAHIRWMGYRFAVLPRGGFLVHSPHVMSSQKSIWLKGKNNELRQSNTALFDAFINELELIYGATAPTTTNESGDRVYPRECVKFNTTPAIIPDMIQSNNITKM